MSYGANGVVGWKWAGDCSCFDYDERLKLLVTASWTNEKKKTVSVSCIKNLDERGIRA